MGSPPTLKGRSDNEHPQHQVTIAKPFAVSKFPLTFDEWDTCVAMGDCAPQIGDATWGRGTRPVIYVTWDLCPAICCVAQANDRQALSAAHRGRIRICDARRHADGLSVGGRNRQQECQLHRLWQRMGWQANVTGWFIRSQRLWALRHGRKCLAVGGGLLSSHLLKCADGWISLEQRRLRSSCRPRQFLVQQSRPPSLCRSRLGRPRPAEFLPGFPDWPDARALILSLCRPAPNCPQWMSRVRGWVALRLIWGIAPTSSTPAYFWNSVEAAFTPEGNGRTTPLEHRLCARWYTF